MNKVAALSTAIADDQLVLRESSVIIAGGMNLGTSIIFRCNLPQPTFLGRSAIVLHPHVTTVLDEVRQQFTVECVEASESLTQTLLRHVFSRLAHSPTLTYRVYDELPVDAPLIDDPDTVELQSVSCLSDPVMHDGHPFALRFNFKLTTTEQQCVAYLEYDRCNCDWVFTYGRSAYVLADYHNILDNLLSQWAQTIEVEPYLDNK